jgi:hypothetical protein
LYATWLSATNAVRSLSSDSTSASCTPVAGSGSSQRIVRPVSAAIAARMNRSVGKFWVSAMISERPGRASTAARMNL